MISVEHAEDLATQFGMKQVIIFAWDGVFTHVVTFGKTELDSAQAAVGANNIKKKWDWPADTIVESAKIEALHKRIVELECERQVFLQEREADALRKW